MTNTRITDPEVLEKYYPVILKAFHLRSDNSGGEGQFKGGEGVIRQMKFREPITLSLLTERRVLEPRGIKGGKNGKCGENLIVRNDGSTLCLGPKTSINMKPGEVLVLKTPGGGGYGDHVTGDSALSEQIDVKFLDYIKPSKGSVNEYRLIQESA